MNAHVSQGGWPVLVLNADFRPLSYYPLSLWSWQDAIKAVFLDRVNIVAHYDRAVHSPIFEIPAAQRRVAEILRQADHPSGLHPVQRVPARPVHLPVLRRAGRPHLRSHHPALQGRPDHLGQRRRGVLAVQSAQGQSDAGAGQDVPAPGAVRADRAPAAPQRTAVPAELSARQLARLSRTGTPSWIRRRNSSTTTTEFVRARRPLHAA